MGTKMKNPHFEEVEKFAASLMKAGIEVGAVRKDCPMDLMVRQYLGNLISFESWYSVNLEKKKMTLDDYYNSGFKDDVKMQFQLLESMLTP